MELILSLIILSPLILYISVFISAIFDKAHKYATKDNETDTLILHQRSEKLSKYIRIKECEAAIRSYKPETLHIGSATVGGVTTGGTYTTGGYYYTSGTRKTGYYKLEWRKCSRISKIQLDDDMYREALLSPISRYLNDKKQIEVIDYSSLSDQDVLDRGAYYLGQKEHISHEVAFRGYPTYEKCKKIMDWITLVEQ